MQKGIDYIGIGVGAIILRNDGCLFLAKRGPLARNERYKWEFPGGSVEFGETLQVALQRELREEYGLSIIIIQLLDVIDHILNDERQHWVSPIYLCRLSAGSPRILEPLKCTDIQWFALDELPLPDMTQASLASFHSLTRYISSSSLSIQDILNNTNQ
jgi:8-oxo-dGTP diphosphatase